jgi:hypothetical protein
MRPSRRARYGSEAVKKPAVSSGFLDGASRTRTGDLLGAIQALSQLSYSPAREDSVAAP